MPRLYRKPFLFLLLTFASILPWQGAGAETRPEDEPPVRAVATALPAVVNINTEHIVRRQVRDPIDELFEQFYGGPMRPPRELRQKVENLGSGVIVDAEGYIVTNEHVIERAENMKIKVTLHDGSVFEARYVAGDTQTDLALIKIDSPKALPFLSLDDSSPALLGQTVLALGNPLGYGNAVSRGIISATKRTVKVGEAEYSNLIQTDAAINPGNSGGALIDLNAKLVGINSVKMAFTPQGIPTQGIGFAIPTPVVRERVAELRKKPAGGGIQSYAFHRFGMRVQDLTQDLIETLGIPSKSGVLVADVEQGSPAAEAGFTPGLVILKVGRYEVHSASDLERLLAKLESGDPADFVIGALRRLRGRPVYQIETVSLTAR